MENAVKSMSDDIGELAAALAKAQSEIKSASKDSSNPFFKSKYADLGSVWEACRDALTKNGIAVMQPLVSNGEIYLDTMLVHSSGQWMRGRAPIKPVKDDPQGLGSAITYMRRYSLAAMVGVVPDDDDDGEGAMGRKGEAGNDPHRTAAEKNLTIAGIKTHLSDAKSLDDINGRWKAINGTLNKLLTTYDEETAEQIKAEVVRHAGGIKQRLGKDESMVNGHPGMEQNMTDDEIQNLVSQAETRASELGENAAINHKQQGEHHGTATES